MYKLRKDEGYGAVVTLENTTNGAILNVGTITVPLLSILKEEVTEIDSYGKWDMKISAETKDKIVKLAMPMKKPIRDQSKKSKPDGEVKVNRDAQGHVDIFDLIYGIED